VRPYGVDRSRTVIHLKISITIKNNRWNAHCRNQFIPRQFFTARCYAERGYATVCRPSVCLSVTFRYRDHIGLNSSKVISRPNSLRLLLGLTPTWAIGATGTPPKLGWNRGGVTQEHKKPAISLKRCKIEPRLLWRTNRKSHTRFRLVPKSRTLDDLERRIQGLPTVFKCPLLSQERVKLRASNLAGTFSASIRTKAH